MFLTLRMGLGYFVVISAFVTIGGVVFAEVSGELVVLHDLNSDHTRRNLDGGLAPLLEFNLRRRSEDIKLTLKENKRLNPNAPVYEIKKDDNGMKTLIKKEHLHIEERFYHDKANDGAFVVRCELSAHGPCRRKVTGSLQLSGKYYDIVPAAEEVTKRGLDDELFGIPHHLTEIKPSKENTNTVSDTLDASDAIQTEEPLVQHNAEPIQSNILRQLNAKNVTLYDVEIMVFVDPFVYERFYEDAIPTETLNREEVTDLNIRRHFSLIINGVSLRYESIEDPDLDIFCTVSGFFLDKEPYESEEIDTDENGYPMAEAMNFLEMFRDWIKLFSDLPESDHAMMFTGFELYSITEKDEISDETEGIAFISRACTENKTSVVQATGSFFKTTLIAAHELGHNLGCSHDGKGTSVECPTSNQYIMTPWLAKFKDLSAYNINPWRFSRCSVEAMKTYISSLGSKNCLTDQGDIYDQEEYEEHLKSLPGERYTLDAQCELVQGNGSKFCESTDMSNMCLVIKCLAPDGECKDYTAARGTACGENKWCIEGACVSKVPEPKATNCTDKGYAEHSCSSLRKVYRTMTDFCHTWNILCCKTCRKHMDCWNGKNSKEYSGYVSWTINGRTCQNWSSQEPHEHGHNLDSMFPVDDSVVDAANNCRDPNGKGTPWCYTTNKDVRWEFCPTLICNVDCYYKSNPQQYRGNVSKLADGTPCQAWSGHAPYEHNFNQPEMFPNDESVLAANNYCRQLPGKQGRPWCLAISTTKVWDWCPVPECVT